MNLIRLIIIGLIIWFLYRAFQRMLEKPRTSEKTKRPTTSRDMVKCAHCGIHIPRDEALEREGELYCSTEHRDAGPR
jgi:uncharacterized protein